MISLKNVSVHYPVQGKVDVRALSGNARAVGGEIVIVRKKPHVLALDRLTFEIPSKTVTGLVGVNGSGKSTLLRVMAQIIPISTGKLVVEGEVSTLFTRNIGLDTNATGRENVRLAAALYDLRKRDVAAMLKDVEEFTQLGPYMDMPVRSYSSGMSARFGFAVATAVHADVVLIDEVIGAGDGVFRARARKRFDEVIRRSGTLVLASHQRELMMEMCDNVIWLDHGRLRAFGPTAKVMNAFQAEIKERQNAAKRPSKYQIIRTRKRLAERAKREALARGEDKV